MIRTHDLTKKYESLFAIRAIELDLVAGDVFGFIGPNGAGKTTTMRVLTGYIPPTEGKAIIGGFDVFESPVEAKTRTGYLPESPPLYPDMTVREYLTFVARIKAVPASNRRQRVDYAMGRTSIDEVADRHCGKLSKGYRQRVGLAQAILHNPDVLILDEPTTGLDPKQIIETRELIKELGGDHTIILSTHILPEVSQTCERVVIINKGRVVAEDTPANLTGRLRGSETIHIQVDSGGVDPASALAAVPGVTEVHAGDAATEGRMFEVQAAEGVDVRRQVANAVVSNGWGLLEMRPVRLSLEDIFLQLTTTEEDEADAAIDESGPGETVATGDKELDHG